MLSVDDTEGLELRWGNSDAAITLLRSTGIEVDDGVEFQFGNYLDATVTTGQATALAAEKRPARAPARVSTVARGSNRQCHHRRCRCRAGSTT